MIILKHRDHGTHFANNELEAQECERNGWIRVPDVLTPLPAPINGSLVAEKDIDQVLDELEQKFAPKPEEPQIKPKFNRSEWMKQMHASGRMKKRVTS